MEHINELNEIKNYYASDKVMRKIINAELVNNGFISRVDLNTVFLATTRADQCSPAVLALVYRTIRAKDTKRNLPPLEYFFTTQEIADSMVLTSRASYDSYPLVFQNAVKISPADEYLISLTFQEIRDLSVSKVMRIRADMQRESEIVRYDSESIPCVRFSESKVHEIKDNILQGRQHPNTLRLHLIPDTTLPLLDSFEYDVNDSSIIIKNGLLANIDGNHRINAIVDAMSENNNIGSQYRMPIILTVGSPMFAREIIVQEEQRTPINADHVLSMKETEGSRIVAKLKMNDDLMRSFRFCSTLEEYKAGGGYFINWMISDAIIKSFKITSKLRPSRVNSLSSYLCDFLSEFYYIVEGKRPGHLATYYRDTNTTMLSCYFVYGLMEMAAKLEHEENWTAQFEAWLDRLDWNARIHKNYINYEKAVLNYIRGGEV